MEVLRKALKKNSNQKVAFSKHKKLPENWEENKEAVKEGVTFYVKYLGSTLVEELEEEGQSYGDAISAEAVKTIVAMAKASGKKLPKMSITVSPTGLKVVNLVNKDIKTDMSIYRISFCTADKAHVKVFAYIARNMENETMECQAFLCGKTKIAHAVTLTVANAFRVAKEHWEDKEKKERENAEKQRISSQAPSENNLHSSHTVTGTLLDFAADSNETVEKHNKSGMVHSRSEPVCSVPPPEQSKSKAKTISGFEDNFAEQEEQDEFASLAMSRSKPSQSDMDASAPFGDLRVGLNPEDIEDGVEELIFGQKLEEFQRQPSVDDLLSL